MDIFYFFRIRYVVLTFFVINFTACQTADKITITIPKTSDFKDVEISKKKLQKHKTIKPPIRTSTYVLYPNSDIIGKLQEVTSHKKDTLHDIARLYDLGYNEIISSNPDVDPWLPGEGTSIVLPTQFILPDVPRKGIVINVAAMRLFYFPEYEDDEIPFAITHPVGIGRENWQTPTGLTKIARKAINPHWYVPASVRAEHAAAGDPLPPVVPPGPDNPLGEYALYLDMPSYLIHGTNKPYGIGRRVTHGCTRLYPEDIKTLFDKVPIGTEVQIVNQPFLAGHHNGIIYLEAHTPFEEDSQVWETSLEPLINVIEKAANKNGFNNTTIDWEKAINHAKLGYGYPVAISEKNYEPEKLFASLSFYQIPKISRSIIDPEEKHSSTLKWYVQSGSFKNEENAKRLTTKLKNLNPPIQTHYLKTKRYNRVLSGPFITQDEAKVIARRIESTIGSETIIIKSVNPVKAGLGL